MRVQNEGTGKSSWWMLNPDAKPGNYVIGSTVISEKVFVSKRSETQRTRGKETA